MVFFKSIFAAAALSGVVNALPRPQQDSALGIEVAVSAPFGIPLTDSVELASQSSFEAGRASTMAAATTTTSSAMAAETTSTSTMAAWNAYSSPSYGSGNSNWGGSGYDDCVNQCMASYGAPKAEYKPTATHGNMGSVGTGATHTVIVAPTQGVLRYIPFAVNASVGDTIKFMWGANNHTVTKGTALTPCNKSGEALFASGLQQKDFVFTQVVNDTKPTYFYCAAPSHCQKGMFGIINPPSSAGASTSVSQMLQPVAANNSDVAAYASYTKAQCKDNEAAGKWGSNIDVAALPAWAHEEVIKNVLYTRNVLASNKEILKDDGSIDLSTTGNTPLMIPQDLSAVLNNAAAAPATPAANAASGTPSAATPSQSSAPLNNGAMSTSSSRVLVAALVAAVTFFSL